MVLNLMTAGEIESLVPGSFVIKTGTEKNPGGKVMINYDSKRLRVRIEEVSLQTSDLKSVWGNKLRRIQLIDEHNSLSESYSIEVREM